MLRAPVTYIDRALEHFAPGARRRTLRFIVLSSEIPPMLQRRPLRPAATPPPSVATIVTAQGGRRRYRVLAYRPLDYPELVQTVEMALAHGWVIEPDAGAEAVIYTSIGIDRTRSEAQARPGSVAAATRSAGAGHPRVAPPGPAAEFARLAGLDTAPRSDTGR